MKKMPRVAKSAKKECLAYSWHGIILFAGFATPREENVFPLSA